MQSSGINPTWCCAGFAECMSQFDLFTRASCPENSWKKAYANANVRRCVDVISDTLVWCSHDFCDRPRDLGNYTSMLKLNRCSLRSRSIQRIFSFQSRVGLPYEGTKRLVSGGNAHDKAVTINKWRRYVHSNVPIQADIWFYKNTNKIRLFTSGIGVLRCAM